MKQDPTTFWTIKNGRHILLKKDSDGKYSEYRQLPYYIITFQDDLNKAGISYSIVDDLFCAVYDPNCIEYELYTSLLIDDSMPYYTEYTGQIPTQRMLDAAESYCEYVNDMLYKLSLQKRKLEFDNFFQKNSTDGISLYCSCSILSPEELLKYRKYYLISFHSDDYTFEGLIIRKKSVAGKKITVKVPQKYAAKLVGVHAKNIRKITKDIGAKYIIVKPLS